MISVGVTFLIAKFNPLKIIKFEALCNLHYELQDAINDGKMRISLETTNDSRLLSEVVHTEERNKVTLMEGLRHTN
jgi:hypothetical protein